jgi:hypothetical protein
LDHRTRCSILADVNENRAAQLAYAHEHLLPIWERWTDGNLAMRRALDCESADLSTHEERRNILFQAQLKLEGYGDSAPNTAAMLAAQSAMYALLGYPLAMVEQVGIEAIVAHRIACRGAVEHVSKPRVMAPTGDPRDYGHLRTGEGLGAECAAWGTLPR